ncbi:MAG: hypothetical protein AAB587_02195 [Patescibacteria group bacterium]
MEPLSREDCDKIVKDWTSTLPGVIVPNAVNEIVKVVEISVARQCAKKESPLSFNNADYRELEDCIRIGAHILLRDAQGIMEHLQRWYAKKGGG